MDTVLNETIASNATMIDTQLHHYGLLGLAKDHVYLTSLVVFLLSLYVVARHFSPTVCPEEPLLVSHRIPFVGHLLGILIYGIKYFDDVGRKTNSPIFTMPILNGKTYVVTSPDLVTACMRETKTLSFNPFIVEVFRRIAGLPAEDMEITMTNMDDKSQPGYMTDMHRVEYAALAPGPALDMMNNVVLNNITTFFLQTLPNDNTQVLDIPLFATVQRIASVSALRATYGEQNPFDADPTLLEDFWLFEKSFKYLLLDVCPAITAPRAHAARARLTAAFVRYYETGAYVGAAQVIRHRYDVARKWDQKITTVAALDVGWCFGVLANAVPALFWMLVYIFRDPDLLSAVREETACLLSSTSSSAGRKGLTVDLRSDQYLRRTCPLLTSVFHEMLRITSSPLSSGRYVLQDTVLTESAGTGRKYLLKKGGTVQIPSHSLHHPLSGTGKASPFATAPADFDPRRFMNFGVKVASEPEKTINGSFRAFGGGATLCPGRKFAFVEILGSAIAFISLWELDGLVGVPLPDMDLTRLAFAVAKPKSDVKVRVRRRSEFEGVDVRVGVGLDDAVM